jgi:hypothetical protein
MNLLPPDYQLFIIQSRIKTERIAAERETLTRSLTQRRVLPKPQRDPLRNRIAKAIPSTIRIRRCTNADCEGTAH